MTKAGTKPKKTEAAPAKAGQCTHCGIKKTPMWRRGPQGIHTLCNGCGVWYKKYNTLEGRPKKPVDPKELAKISQHRTRVTRPTKPAPQPRAVVQKQTLTPMLHMRPPFTYRADEGLNNERERARLRLVKQMRTEKRLAKGAKPLVSPAKLSPCLTSLFKCLQQHSVFSVPKPDTDLTVIQIKMESGAYRTIEELEGDISSLLYSAKVQNAMDSQLYKHALMLQKMVADKMRELRTAAPAS
eukprot:Colp12_sorted_trinity150504_noHs@22966